MLLASAGHSRQNSTDSKGKFNRSRYINLNSTASNLLSRIEKEAPKDKVSPERESSFSTLTRPSFGKLQAEKELQINQLVIFKF
jgi:hypothetical protein